MLNKIARLNNPTSGLITVALGLLFAASLLHAQRGQKCDPGYRLEGDPKVEPKPETTEKKS